MLDHHSTMCTNKCCLSTLYLQGEFNRAFQSDFYGEELMEAEWCSDRKQGARSKEQGARKEEEWWKQGVAWRVIREAGSSMETGS
ncbi:hypothetical protein E1A91_A13G030400v1 [Gossypium mustelinum]|uniref:Uncharacterized protein n=1 Tax=Gossypium mustelinum TaxID=34275 RepID=A0A5D2WDD0_GOSMU|nr:hypothetical protein E1A91_A13G030400v1 [Gossypium mustelinum]